MTQNVCDAAGMPAYEISNHAVPGAESRHNLVYWRYGEYAGIGPGAHGRLKLADGRHATAAERAPEAWLEKVESWGDGLVVDDRTDAGRGRRRASAHGAASCRRHRPRSLSQRTPGARSTTRASRRCWRTAWSSAWRAVASARRAPASSCSMRWSPTSRLRFPAPLRRILAPDRPSPPARP